MGADRTWVRLGPVVGVAALAPVTAELLQAYLGDIGGPFGLVSLVIFFAPLYGGAALLIREVAVRTGRGWPGRLLLGTAFGVAMPTLVDVSLFTVHNPEVAGWEDIVNAASVGGIGVYAVVTWVAGHALMSVAAPLAVVDSLARRSGPWLGRTATGIVAALMLVVAVAVHREQTASNVVDVSGTRYAASAAVVVLIIMLAFTPLGRPVRRRPASAAPAPWVCVCAGVVLVAVFDLVPMSWLGAGIDLAVLTIGGLLVLRWSASAWWGPRHIAALTFGGVLARTLVGFAAPLPTATTWTEKISQNVFYLVLVLALGFALQRRTRAAHLPTQ